MTDNPTSGGPIELDLIEGVGYTRTQGRARVDINAQFVRDLEPADIALLGTEGRTVKPQALQALKDRHHRIAQMLAMGLRPWEISAQTGVSVNRISILQADPAFEELLAHYSKEIQEGLQATGIDLVSQYAGFASDAMAELHRRLEDAPDEFTVGSLTEAIKTFGDRAGAGPVNKSVNINVDMADRLQAARRRAGLSELPGPGTPAGLGTPVSVARPLAEPVTSNSSEES